MGEADLADEFELRVFAEGRNCLCDLEHTADDVVRGVAECPLVNVSKMSLVTYEVACYAYQRSLSISSASSIFCSWQALIIACTLTG